MAQPTRTRAQLRVDILKKIDPVSEPKTSSTTSGGSTTTLLDSLLAPGAESEDFVGDWIYIAEKQGSGPEVGEIARVTAVDFSGSTSTLTLAPALTATLETGADYERHRKVRPNIINDRLDVILGLVRQNVILPATIITDGDMEDDPASNMSGGAATVTNSTAFVRHGRQSLKAVATGALDQARTGEVFVLPNTECIVSADIYVQVNSDVVEVQFRDGTNTALIGTAMKTDATGWVHFEGRFTVPADAYKVSVWVQLASTNDTVYLDHITVWPVQDKGIDLPSFLEFLFDVESLFFYPVGTSIAGSNNINAYRINEGAPEFYAHNQKELDDTGVGASRFYVPSRTPTNALWIKGRKPYPVFAGATDALKDADTTQANRYVLTNMTAASIIDDLALDAIEAEKFELARKLTERALLLRFEINHIMANLTPPNKLITTPFTRKRV